MIWTVARKEFLEIWRDGRFRLVGALVFLLLTAALLLGWQHSVDVSRDRAAAQDVSRRQWLDQGGKNPHSAAHHSIFAFKPIAPLALADPGIDPFTGIAVWLEAHKQNELSYSAARDATASARFGQLTAATVLQVLVPLVIILLSFGAFAGEREAGTLRQALSLGVTRHHLALGKILGVALALGLLLVPATVVGSAALGLGSETIAFSASLPRFVVLVLIYLAFFLAVLAVSFAISALAPSSRVALVVLLAFWSVNLVLPRIATDLAKNNYPTPTALEFQAAVAREMREGIDGHNPQDERGEQLKQELLAQYGVKTVEDLPVNFDGIALQEGEEYGNRVYDRHYGDLWTSYERQNTVHTLTGMLAPLAAVRAVSMGLAGSDWRHHRHFAESAEVYRRMLVKRMNDEVAYNSVAREYDKNRRGRELYEQVPDFSYRAPTLGWVIGKQILPLALLAAWAAGRTRPGTVFSKQRQRSWRTVTLSRSRSRSKRFVSKPEKMRFGEFICVDGSLANPNAFHGGQFIELRIVFWHSPAVSADSTTCSAVPRLISSRHSRFRAPALARPTRSFPSEQGSMKLIALIRD